MKLQINHFKSIENCEIDLGRVNVLIGANGSGKSSLLEAIGVLSAALHDRVEDRTLRDRGVRLGTPALYKSSFHSQGRIPNTIEICCNWEHSDQQFSYKVNLTNPVKEPKPSWEFFSEILTQNKNRVFGRSNATFYKIENFPSVKIDKYRGLLSFLKGITIGNEGVFNALQSLYETFEDYGIYAPNTSNLRGISPDPYQRDPIGLFGGRLPEAVEDLLDNINDSFGTMDMDDLLDLLGWVQSITIGRPSKYAISPSAPTTSKTIVFKDRFMKEGRDELTPYDASEGALYVLFVLCLAMHPKAPKMFAIDNFDQALNPRLVRELTEVFCAQVIENKKTALLTTHNPLVLDGLDLTNDQIRLFAVDRNSKGQTKISRVVVDDELLKLGKDGHTLSRLWVMGRLGGVPNL